MLISTTTVTITRPDGSGDPYDPASATVEQIASAVAAHISAPSGVDARVGGDQEQIDAVLLIDPVTIDRNCLVHDDLTGVDYGVTWSQLRTGLGLSHVKAGLTLVRGGSNG